MVVLVVVFLGEELKWSCFGRLLIKSFAILLDCSFLFLVGVLISWEGDFKLFLCAADFIHCKLP